MDFNGYRLVKVSSFIYIHMFPVSTVLTLPVTWFQYEANLNYYWIIYFLFFLINFTSFVSYIILQFPIFAFLFFFLIPLMGVFFSISLMLKCCLGREGLLIENQKTKQIYIYIYVAYWNVYAEHWCTNIGDILRLRACRLRRVNYQLCSISLRKKKKNWHPNYSLLTLASQFFAMCCS